MIKYISIIIHLFIVSNMLSAQPTFENRKSVYFELGGSGGLGSINYESLFLNTRAFDLFWRAGLSVAPIDNNNGTGIVFPLMISALIGETSHKLELGVGQGVTVTTKGSIFSLTTVALGYRYQPATQRWFYRVTYTPLISYLVDFQMQQWFGLSIGYKL